MNLLSRRGFQAPESLVVTAIVALLAGILLPAVAKAFFPGRNDIFWLLVGMALLVWLTGFTVHLVLERRARKRIERGSKGEQSTPPSTKG